LTTRSGIDALRPLWRQSAITRSSSASYGTDFFLVDIEQPRGVLGRRRCGSVFERQLDGRIALPLERASAALEFGAPQNGSGALDFKPSCLPLGPECARRRMVVFSGVMRAHLDGFA